MNPPESTPARRRNLWPLGIILGLAFVVTTNMVMVYIAIQHPSVPETEHHWEESLAFNEEYALREQSQAKGWRLAVHPCASLDQDDQCTLKIEILDKDNKQVPDLAGTVSLRRGDHTQSDREVSLLASGNTYLARFAMGRRGVYTIEVHTTGQAQSWKSSRRMSIEPLPFPGRHS